MSGRRLAFFIWSLTTYIVAGIGLHGNDVTLFQRQFVGVYEESLAGVLELNLNVIALIGSRHTSQIVKRVQLPHAAAATLAAYTAASVIEYEILIHILLFH